MTDFLINTFPTCFIRSRMQVGNHFFLFRRDIPFSLIGSISMAYQSFAGCLKSENILKPN